MITISALAPAPPETAWEVYTNPEHIVHWNFASDDWHCPWAKNDLRVGGTYVARMEAKDGSFGFDFEVVYTAIEPFRSLDYVMGEGEEARRVRVTFTPVEGGTEVVVAFDPENMNDLEMQRAGWQAILDNYVKRVAGR